MNAWENPRIQLLLRTHKDLLEAELACVDPKAADRLSVTSAGTSQTPTRNPPDQDERTSAAPGRVKEFRRRLATLRFRAPAADRKDSISPGELFLLEAQVIERLVDPHERALRLIALRELLASLLSPESYNELVPHLLQLSRIVPQTTGWPGSNPSRRIQAECKAISSRLYRRIGGLPAVEAIRAEIAFGICVSALVAIVAAVVADVGLARAGLTHYWFVMGAWGALGATVSTIERLYRVDLLHEPLKMAITLSGGLFPLFFSPFVGLIFALVLYLLFRGEFIDGTLFPKVGCVESAAYLWLVNYPKECMSVDFHCELAKMFVWGFAAGWTERMVPDALNRLAPQASDGLKSTKAH